MLINEFDDLHKEEIKEMKAKFESKIADLEDTQRILNQNINTLQKYSQKLELDVANEKSVRMKIEEEFVTNSKNHEEEVQLRLKFESKLNNMHSIHRDVDGKYKRSLKEMETAMAERDSLQEKAKQYYSELLEIKRIKEEKEAEIEFKDEKIKTLTKENAMRKDQINMLESKLLAVQKSVEFKLNIEYIPNDSQKLEFAKYQPEERDDVYEQKFKDLEITYRQVVEELQRYKRESLIFQEVLKEKEERIAQTKTLLSEVQNSLKILDKQYSVVKLDYERATLNINDHRNELEDTINKLKMTNKVRNENEIRLNEVLESEKELKKLLAEKEERIQKYILEIQKIEKLYFSAKKEKELIQADKINELKQFEVVKRQYAEKVTSLTEIISTEKEGREMWVDRFNREQSAHSVTKNENLKLKNTVKDLEVENQNVGIKIDSEERLK